jgi:tetratricopeptide (TPR) repeat protein
MAEEHHPLRRLLPALAVAAALGACALPAPYRAPPAAAGAVPVAPPPAAAEPPPAEAPPAEPTPRPPVATREVHLSAATRSLVTQARAQLAHGDLPAAAVTLDRALRIEPSNPLLWIEVGRLRLAESDARQAESCGRKALALASGDRGAQSQAGHLLADALRAQRRNQEAREVESQAYMN